MLRQVSKVYLFILLYYIISEINEKNHFFLPLNTSLSHDHNHSHRSRGLKTKPPLLQVNRSEEGHKMELKALETPSK